MFICNKDFASSKAIELAKIAIESSNTFIKAEEIIDYMEKIYQYFITGEVK